MPRQSKFGTPLDFTPKSAMTVLMVEPSAAFSQDQPSTDLDGHQTPYSYNWHHRDGRMEVRRGLSQSTQTSNPMGVTVTGGMEIVSSTGSFYPLISGTSRFAYHDGVGWSVLSYTSAFGNSAPPSGTSRDWYDMTYIYLPAVDDNIAVMACASQQTLFCWRAGSTVFSGLTSAPKAKYVTAFDNFLMAFNIKDSSGSNYVQRVQWSDRGNPSNWTGALSGFEDLLDARGQGTRILAQDNRVLLFFESEIWQAQRGTFPQTFRFTPLDRTIGTPYGRTVVDTPYGVMFLGRDQMLYLLPHEGGPAQAVGQNVHRYLQGVGGNSPAWALWDGIGKQYQLFYDRTSYGLPSEALYVPMPELTFNLQVWSQGLDIGKSHGFTAYRQTGVTGTTWSQASTAGYTWDTIPGMWSDYDVQTSLRERAVFLGGSNGTMYRVSSTATMDDNQPISALWQSPSLGGHSPEAIKTITQIRLDYQALASGTVMTVFPVNATGAPSSTKTLATVSGAGYPPASIRFDVYWTDRYPSFNLWMPTAFGGTTKINRIWVTMREGGRSYHAVNGSDT